MSQLTITKHPATIHYFTEDLGDKIELDMVLIPTGRFEMGSPADELERRDNEGPQHSVTVPSFFMGRTPITQAQWRQVVKLPQVKDKLDNPDPSRFKGPELPVEQVSWDDATEFCARLSRHTQREYRLPSEAEWEYACRAGTTTAFHFGETIDAEVANYQAQDEKIGDTTYPGKYGRGKFGEYCKHTTPVGSFPPNQFGLYDMHGNVWEWCMDDWHDNYKKAPNDGSVWLKNVKTASTKVLRGGSWLNHPRDCRSAYRSSYSRDLRSDGIGVRVVCCAPSSPA
jgi:formylglycine-generating enzyme required for sulfatase activity